MILLRYILALIAKLFSKRSPSTGLVDDPRPEEEKQRDWLHEERAASQASNNPFGFTKIVESDFPYLNQNFTLSCVPHSVGLAAAIERYVDTGVYVEPAPMFVYRHRSNYPNGGMWPQQAFELIKKYGIPQYWSLPTPKSEDQANAISITPSAYNEAAIYKGKNYFKLEDPTAFEEIARISAQGHGVPICIFATQSEWQREYPEILEVGLVRNSPAATLQHDICVLPHSGFIENGVRYVTVQDSAWFANMKIRHLSEAFIKARTYDAGYWDTVNVIGGGPRPVYTFKKTVKFGDRGEEVRNIQLLLISENLLPADCATGYCGGLTIAGIRAFQKKYEDEILKPLDLEAPTNTWGSMCIGKANALCIR